MQQVYKLKALIALSNQQIAKTFREEQLYELNATKAHNLLEIT
jgi:hypothetical protein